MSRHLHITGPARRQPRRWSPPLVWSTIPPTARACCCPGPPVVQAVLPPTPQRPEPVELLLCQHHYRRSREALAAAGAAAYDSQGGPLATPTAGFTALTAAGR